MQITLKNREDLVNQYSYKEYSKLDETKRNELVSEILSQTSQGEFFVEGQEPYAEDRARQIIMSILVKEFDDYSDNEFLEFLSNHDKELLEKAVISDVKRNKVFGLF